MSARTDVAHAFQPLSLLRWLIGPPGVIWAAIAAAFLWARPRKRRLSLPRMSDEWLLSHERDAANGNYS